MNTSTALSLGTEFTPEQLKLITDTVAKGATKDELQLFLHRCRIMNLNPLKPGTIHFIKFGSGPGTIVVGIEGFRSIAARTGKISGIKRGVIKNEKGLLLAAWAEVHRSDWKEPAREEVPFAEYDTGKGPWAKMPETMLKKVAEAAVLRMAFPDDLGGIYVKEEMDQAEADRGRVYPEEPGPEDGVTPDHGYRIPFGKWNRRSLEEVEPKELVSYISFLENSALKKGVEITGPAKEFIERASSYLAALENGTRTEDEDIPF